jgi:hypothetical protein
MQPLSAWQTFILGVGVAALGITLIRQARAARRTGVAHFIGQWPNDISRDNNPIGFRSSVLVASFAGYFMLFFAVLCLVSLITGAFPIYGG